MRGGRDPGILRADLQRDLVFPDAALHAGETRRGVPDERAFVSAAFRTGTSLFAADFHHGLPPDDRPPDPAQFDAADPGYCAAVPLQFHGAVLQKFQKICRHESARLPEKIPPQECGILPAQSGKKREQSVESAAGRRTYSAAAADPLVYDRKQESQAERDRVPAGRSRFRGSDGNAETGGKGSGVSSESCARTE